MSDLKLNGIRLKNFKCHKDFSQELKMVNILAGENAAGKSSVIQAILLYHKAKNGDNSFIRTIDVMGNNLGLPEELINYHHENGQIEISIQNETGMDTVVYTPSDIDEFALDISQEKDTFLPSNLFYINAERQGPRTINTIEDVMDYHVGIRGEKTVSLMVAVDKIQKTNRDFVLSDNLTIAEISRFSANCEAWLDRIIPGTKLQVRSFPEQGISAAKYSNTESGFFNPPATGFGLSYVLPIIVQGLVATMCKDAILVIENPEAHLHPYSQSMIGKFIAEIATEGVQIIVETHSEHFINGCRLKLAQMGKCDEAKIVFFSKEDNIEYKSITLNEYGELSEWPKRFFDQTQQDLKELLRLKYEQH